MDTMRTLDAAAQAALSRRSFCHDLGMAAAAALLGSCELSSGPRTPRTPRGPHGPHGPRGDARLHARPGTPTGSIAPGIHALGLGGARDGLIVVPAGYDASRRWPMALFFHGAVTPPRAYMEAFQPLADEVGIVLLAPQSRARTWDRVLGEFGPDVAFIDRALAELFRRVAVDPARMAMSGFSDGGSYALSLGASNGDVMRRIAAYSPGFFSPAERLGQPSFFITHGTRDTVLPIQTTSRRIVRALRELGYAVEYREFDGGHGVELTLAKESLGWMAE